MKKTLTKVFAIVILIFLFTSCAGSYNSNLKQQTIDDLEDAIAIIEQLEDGKITLKKADDLMDNLYDSNDYDYYDDNYKAYGYILDVLCDLNYMVSIEDKTELLPSDKKDLDENLENMKDILYNEVNDEKPETTTAGTIDEKNEIENYVESHGGDLSCLNQYGIMEIDLDSGHMFSINANSRKTFCEAADLIPLIKIYAKEKDIADYTIDVTYSNGDFIDGGISWYSSDGLKGSILDNSVDGTSGLKTDVPYSSIDQYIERGTGNNLYAK